MWGGKGKDMRKKIKHYNLPKMIDEMYFAKNEPFPKSVIFITIGVILLTAYCELFLK